MKLSKVFFAATVTVTLAATTAATVSPAAAWCRWGRCGYGPGYGGAVAAGVLTGALVGAAVAAPVVAARPVVVEAVPCPVGYHLGRSGRVCRPN